DSEAEGDAEGEDAGEAEGDEGSEEGDEEAEGEDDVEESVDLNEFDALDESALSELEKVSNKKTEDLIGSGGSKLSVNKDSVLPKAAKGTEMANAKELVSKKSEHKGFDREQAPAVKEIGKFKNAHKTGDATLGKVSKEGDKGSMLNSGEG